MFKFLTCGGFGLLWVYDIMAISGGSIYAKEYRVADDMLEGLPGLLTPSFFIMVGFVVSMANVVAVIKRKREQAMCFGKWEDGIVFSKNAEAAYNLDFMKNQLANDLDISPRNGVVVA